MNNTKENIQKNNEHKVFVDYNIFSGPVRLVDNDGKMTVIDRDKAIELAKKNGMNLVQVAYIKNEYPKAVCKIINYGKYKFEQKKRDRENARKMRIANADAKEVVFTIRIDDGDYNHKLSQIRKFITEDSLKVKITIKLSRRELSVKSMAVDLMKKILSNFNDIATIDGTPENSGTIISCTIRPNSRK